MIASFLLQTMFVRMVLSVILSLRSLGLVHSRPKTKSNIKHIHYTTLHTHTHTDEFVTEDHTLTVPSSDADATKLLQGGREGEREGGGEGGREGVSKSTRELCTHPSILLCT